MKKNELNDDTKIIVGYHKKAPLVKNKNFVPLQLGKDLSADNWLPNYMEGDNTGDNISNKNKVFNEMTAIYWMWKNYDKLGNPNFVGYVHYRRFFVFEEKKFPYYEAKKIDENFYKKIKYSNLETLLQKNSCIVPMPAKRKSVYENYKKAHNIEDLDLAIDILNKKYPEYNNVAKDYLKNNKIYFFNMFVFNKETFFRYASWIFDILFEYEKQTNNPNERYFISERLTGIFIQKLIDENKKVLKLPIIFIPDKKKNFKNTIKEVKNNLSKNMNFVYAIKPLVIYLTPKFLIKLKKQLK